MALRRSTFPPTALLPRLERMLAPASSAHQSPTLALEALVAPLGKGAGRFERGVAQMPSGGL